LLGAVYVVFAVTVFEDETGIDEGEIWISRCLEWFDDGTTGRRVGRWRVGGAWDIGGCDDLCVCDASLASFSVR
jgi:hypothetical protein